MSEFRMPSLGADMATGTLVEWLVDAGDRVTRGQIVAVVETQKGAIDVEIFDEGEILELLVQPASEVPVGTVLAVYRRSGEEALAAPSRPAELTPAPAPARASAGPVVAPRARKLAEQLGVDLNRVAGTGPDGSITGADVEAAAHGPGRSGMREAIAAAMSRSKREIPHYYLFHTVDLEPALIRLEARNADRPIAERILPVALLVRALARALTAHRELCGHWRDGAFAASQGIHVGVAVARRDGGLINPAVHDADRGTLESLMERIRDVGQRARSGGLRASELSDASITLTSLGDRGVDSVLAVIQPPQVAIVGAGTVRARPWVVDGEVVARRLIDLGLAADHRVSDGHGGARLLREIERLLATPEALS